MNQENPTSQPFMNEEELSYLRTFIAKSFRDARKRSSFGEGPIDWIATASAEIAEGLLPIMIQKVQAEIFIYERNKAQQEKEQAKESPAEKDDPEINKEPAVVAGTDTKPTASTIPAADTNPSTEVLPSK